MVWRGLWYLPRARTVELRARADDRVFHSLAVEYEQRGGNPGTLLHGDSLEPYRLFRSPVGSFDAWLASAAAWTGAGSSAGDAETGAAPLIAGVRAVVWSAAVLIYVSFWRLAPYGDVTVLLTEP